jgi:peptidoglycan/LPS O-acetylase OafA/YrhL
VRIPSLDGQRAVSILLVLMAHLAGTQNAPNLAWTRMAGDIGSLGVRVFFVISGFVMTVLLEREFDSTGRISLAGFLRRRVFRILPAFVVYVGAIALMGAAGVIVLQSRDLLMSATFTMNYTAERSWYLGHLWSLSVEAQFYVGWAVLRILVGRSRLRAAAVGALATAPAARVAMHVIAPQWRPAIGEALPTIVDALAAGALLAILHQQLGRSAAYVRVVGSTAAGAATPLAVLALNAAKPHIAFSYTVGETLMNLLIAVIMHRLIMFPDRAAGRLLNTTAVGGFGALSYSLYLWQQPFLNRESASVFAAFPLNIALAIAAALLSYRLVERPALEMSRRLVPQLRPSSHTGSIRVQAHAAIS